MALNWNVDVAKELEEYLEDLDGISISFDGGRTSLNFAEAAILIQGSAVVYSRKVEYLYSLIYQALDVISAKCESCINMHMAAHEFVLAGIRDLTPHPPPPLHLRPQPR